MSTRRRRSASATVPESKVDGPEAEVKEIPVVTVKVPEFEVMAAFDNLRTQIGGIDSKLKSMDEKMRPVDLGRIEEGMKATTSAVGELRGSLTDVEKELRMYNTLFKAVLGVGVVGVLLVIGVILRLTGHL